MKKSEELDADRVIRIKSHHVLQRGVYPRHDDMPSETFILGVSFCSGATVRNRRLLPRSWQFRNGRFHDFDNLSSIIQHHGDMFSHRESLEQVRILHRERNDFL